MYISVKTYFSFAQVLTVSILNSFDSRWLPGTQYLFPMGKGQLTESPGGFFLCRQPKHLFLYLFKRCPAMFLDDQLSCRLDDSSTFDHILNPIYVSVIMFYNELTRHLLYDLMVQST